MARTINFVRERQRNLSRQEVLDRKILRQTIAALFVVGGLLVMVVGARLSLLAWHDNIKSQQQAAIREIQQKEEIERSYTVFASKLNIVTELFGKRKEKQDALAYFSSLFDPDIIISQLTYTADDDTLTFTIQAPSIFRMEQVFTIVQGQAVKARYPMLQLDSLRRAQDGKYGIQVTLSFGEEATQLRRIEINEEGEVVEIPEESPDQNQESSVEIPVEENF